MKIDRFVLQVPKNLSQESKYNKVVLLHCYHEGKEMKTVRIHKLHWRLKCPNIRLQNGATSGQKFSYNALSLTYPIIGQCRSL